MWRVCRNGRANSVVLEHPAISPIHLFEYFTVESSCPDQFSSLVKCVVMQHKSHLNNQSISWNLCALGNLTHALKLFEYNVVMGM